MSHCPGTPSSNAAPATGGRADEHTGASPDYARTLGLTRVRLCLAARRAILDYGLDGCAWRERLQITLRDDGTLAPITRTRGGVALAELDTTSHGMSYVLFEGQKGSRVRGRRPPRDQPPVPLWHERDDQSGQARSRFRAARRTSSSASEALAMTELIGDSIPSSVDAASAAIGAYIEVFYNARRRHSSIGYASPIEYELKSHILSAAA